MLSHTITVGAYTRKHGAPLSYDIADPASRMRLEDRLGTIVTAELREMLRGIALEPEWLQKNHSVRQFVAAVTNELLLRGE
jgi:hypothetical protein